MVRAALLVGVICLLQSAAAVAATNADQASFIVDNTSLVDVSIPDLVLTASSYPQALPNDGLSEADIQVELTSAGTPLASQPIKAFITAGDGLLLIDEDCTDSHGVASFSYRVGVIPEPGMVRIVAEEAGAETVLEIPLAPITYLDVLLVTPEEYAAHLERQASAAPIYALAVSAFPQQLAADGGSLAMIWAQLDHTAGGPAAGVPLVAEIISGEGSLVVEEVATDQDGCFELYFCAGMTPGTVTVQVIEPSTGLTSAVDLMLVEAGPARIEMFYLPTNTGNLTREGALLPADGMSGLPIVAEVKDLFGVPLTGVELRVEILDDSNGWLEILDPISDAEGRVEFTYHAGTTLGPVRLRSYVADGLDYEQ